MKLTARDLLFQDDKTERDALRLLCSVLIKPITRVELCRLIDPSQFRSLLNRAVFEEIATMGALPSPKLRAALPERIIACGFPEFDLKEFLGAAQITQQEIEKLFESVLKMVQLAHDEDLHGEIV
jgi:hypothetical protein